MRLGEANSVSGEKLEKADTAADTGTLARSVEVLSRKLFVVGCLAWTRKAQDTQGPASGIYLGDLKLIRNFETSGVKLFDIANDPGERRDLAAQWPDKAKGLHQRLTDYLASVNAQMPTTNPDYNSSEPAPEPMRGGKGKEGKAFAALSMSGRN